MGENKRAVCELASNSSGEDSLVVLYLENNKPVYSIFNGLERVIPSTYLSNVRKSFHKISELRRIFHNEEHFYF